MTMPPSSKRNRRIVVYGVGHSLWSANQLPAQVIERLTVARSELQFAFRFENKVDASFGEKSHRRRAIFCKQAQTDLQKGTISVEFSDCGTIPWTQPLHRPMCL